MGKYHALVLCWYSGLYFIILDYNSWIRNKTHVPTHKIPKDVQTNEIGHLAASVDVAASYRFANFMRVSKYRKDIVYGKRENKDIYSYILFKAQVEPTAVEKTKAGFMKIIK